MVQATLRRQYENNYLDARKQLGKMRVERLFSKLKAASRTSQSAEIKNILPLPYGFTFSSLIL